MKYCCLLVLAVCLSLSSMSQSKQQTAVAAAVEKLRLAMVDGNRSELGSIASDSLSYGHSGGKIENKEAFVENIASGKSDFVSIELSEQTISIVNNNAIVRHTLNAATNDGGKPATVKLKILLVWIKEKGQWKLLARQAIKLT